MKGKKESTSFDYVNLGIGFECQEELAAFEETVREYLEIRVGEKICSTLTPDQIREYEKISRNDPYLIAKWLGDNCPNYRDFCSQISNDIKKELLAYRAYIPGLSQDTELLWRGHDLNDLEGLSIREYKMLKHSHVDTIGELASLDEETLRRHLKIPPRRISNRLKELQTIIEESRSQMGLTLVMKETEVASSDIYDYQEELPLDFETVPSYVVGDRITHPRFGIGKITKIHGSTQNSSVTVEFEKVGVKKLGMTWMEKNCRKE